MFFINIYHVALLLRKVFVGTTNFMEMKAKKVTFPISKYDARKLKRS
jgi:hypothetical protein